MNAIRKEVAILVRVSEHLLSDSLVATGDASISAAKAAGKYRNGLRASAPPRQVALPSALRRSAGRSASGHISLRRKAALVISPSCEELG
jgi:hypothetical protein